MVAQRFSQQDSILPTGLSRLNSSPATVDGDCCARDVAGLWRGQERNNLSYLFGLGASIEQGGASQLLGAIRCSSPCEHWTRGHGVDPNTVGTELGGPGPSQR